MNELVEAAGEKQWNKAIARCGRVGLLCIDGLGHMELDRRGAELLFPVLAGREQNDSVPVASDESFGIAHMFRRTCARWRRRVAGSSSLPSHANVVGPVGYRPRILAPGGACGGGTLSLMSEPTPDDHDRAAYSREGLARLVLADNATEVADSAAGVVGTRNDADTGFGGRVGQARQLIELAERTLNAAIIDEAERGSSWTQIAACLDISAEDAEERYSCAVQAGKDAFDEPYRPDETGRRRIPQLPTAAYDPNWACAQLDRWACLRHVGIDDRQAASASLVMAESAGERIPAEEETTR